MNITEVIFSFWKNRPNSKQTPSGWIAGNAVCCEHIGYTKDTRKRAGLFFTNVGGAAYNCFNCGFRAKYVPGLHLSRKMKNLLHWMGVDDITVNKLTIEALRADGTDEVEEIISIPEFLLKSLPKNSIKLSEKTISNETIPAIEYLYSRGLTIDDYNFYYSPALKDSIIIPFYYNYRCVGFTARKYVDTKIKYYTEHTPGYVFNLDNQHWQNKYVILVEGPFDAIAINGIAILGAEVMKNQALLINSLQKQVIVVPDRDKAGDRIIKHALENNWSVSMPEWDKSIKDVNDAVKHYGKIYTLQSIIDSAETYELKIKLRKRKWIIK